MHRRNAVQIHYNAKSTKEQIALFVHFFNSANDTENCVLHTELHTVNVLQRFAVLKSAEKRCMPYQSCHFFTLKQ